MEYTQLTNAQVVDIRRQKLLEIEAEHARLALDLSLAAGVGVQTDQVAQGRANLSLLERQHKTLHDLMFPPAETGGEAVSDNGAKAPVNVAV
jgi:DNA-binding XRE family transcriptional regulator